MEDPTIILLTNRNLSRHINNMLKKKIKCLSAKDKINWKKNPKINFKFKQKEKILPSKLLILLKIKEKKRSKRCHSEIISCSLLFQPWMKGYFKFLTSSPTILWIYWQSTCIKNLMMFEWVNFRLKRKRKKIAEISYFLNWNFN